MSILIAEDDPTSAKVVEIVLKKYGFQFHTVENGRLALDYLLVTPHVKMVISDIMMPEMDGLELLSNLRKTREFANIQTIMCTTRADVDTVRRAVKSGVGDYIIKPVNPLQLLRKVEMLLERQPPVLKEYRDLVIETRVDRHTYSEFLKAFNTMVDDQLELVDEHIEENQPLFDGEVNEFAERCAEIGAVRLYNLLTGSADVLCNKVGDLEDMLGELRLMRREIQLLQYSLP